MQIHGHCDPLFQSVYDEFERNFGEHGDIGVSVCNWTILKRSSLSPKQMKTSLSVSYLRAG